jgi:hypothetical protein
MIEIRYRDGIWQPTVVCDRCGGEIRDFKKAIVTWGDAGKPRHLHKFVCDNRLDPLWCDLAEHLFPLLYNSGVKTRKLKAAFDEVSPWH